MCAARWKNITWGNNLHGMIYLLYGDNVEKSRATLRKFRERFKREASGAWRHIDCEDDDAEDRLAHEIGGSSLFANKDFVIIEHPSALSEKAAGVLAHMLERWTEDDSVVVCYERGTPKSKIFTLLTKLAAKKEEFKNPPESARLPKLGERELFALGDAWGRRERARAVLLYEALLRNGFEPFSILTTLMWHVRMVALVSHKKTEEISSAFVARKAAEEARNFTESAVDDAYFALLSMSDPRGSEFLETRLLYFLLTN